MKSDMYKSMFETESFHWYFKSKHEIVLSIIDNYHVHNAQIVDFGCGCGLMLKLLSKYGNVTGIDYSHEALKYCEQNFDGELIQGDLQSFHSENKYDLAVALDILEHIDHDDIAAKTIYDSLNPNGLCVFTVPAFKFLWSKHDENCMHKRRYSKKQLESLLINAGFTLDYISYYDFWLFPPVFLIRTLAKIFKFDKDSSIENNFKDGFLNTVLYRIFSSEKRMIAKKRHMPFGVSVLCIARKGGSSNEPAKPKRK